MRQKNYFRGHALPARHQDGETSLEKNIPKENTLQKEGGELFLLENRQKKKKEAFPPAREMPCQNRGVSQPIKSCGR